MCDVCGLHSGAGALGKEAKLSLKPCSLSMRKLVCFSKAERANSVGSVVIRRLVKQRFKQISMNCSAQVLHYHNEVRGAQFQL